MDRGSAAIAFAASMGMWMLLLERCAGTGKDLGAAVRTVGRTEVVLDRTEDPFFVLERVLGRWPLGIAHAPAVVKAPDVASDLLAGPPRAPFGGGTPGHLSCPAPYMRIWGDPLPAP
ncbi:hypothetical protein GCM10010388_48790 [Streptomyces mauvecolor]